MLLLNVFCVSQVSAWGGYVFIINLIPLHVFVLLLMQRFSRRVYIGEQPHTNPHTRSCIFSTYTRFKAMYIYVEAPHSLLFFFIVSSLHKPQTLLAMITSIH